MSQMLAALDGPARSGDVHAACRLAIELVRCRAALSWDSDSIQRRIEGLARAGFRGERLESATQELVEADAYNTGLRSRCAGISEAQLRQSPRYAFAAAQRGHVPSMLTFADATGMTNRDLFEDPAYFEAYRTHAWAFFQRALEAGHPAAVTTWLSTTHAVGFNFLSGVMPQDWNRPEVAEALLARIRNDISILPGSGATPAGVSEADRQRADQLYERSFSNSPWVGGFAQQVMDAVADRGDPKGRIVLDEQWCTNDE